MEIKRFINGPFSVNTYLVIDGESSIIIDPGHDCSRMINFINENKIKPLAILFTHAHIDHIAGGNELCSLYYGLKKYLHEDDSDLLSQASFQAKMFSLPDPGTINVDQHITDCQKLVFGSLEILAIQTPGHSQGSLCFLIKDSIFTGDVLFRENIGRTDIFGGNQSDLMHSIKDKILTLPGETKIYPGHGPFSDIEYELKNNPHIK